MAGRLELVEVPIPNAIDGALDAAPELDARSDRYLFTLHHPAAS